eukprot:5126555-Pleurochrysis_carterae.AAC.3
MTLGLLKKIYFYYERCVLFLDHRVLTPLLGESRLIAISVERGYDISARRASNSEISIFGVLICTSHGALSDAGVSSDFELVWSLPGTPPPPLSVA